MEAECVCVYASRNAAADSLSFPIVESTYVFTRFKKAERSFGCCCQNTIDIRIQVFVYKYGLWGIIPTLLSIFLVQG